MSKPLIPQTKVEQFKTLIRAFFPGTFIHYKNYRQTLGRFEGTLAYVINSHFICNILLANTGEFVASVNTRVFVRDDLIPRQLYIGDKVDSLIRFLIAIKRQGFYSATYPALKEISEYLKSVQIFDAAAVKAWKEFND